MRPRHRIPLDYLEGGYRGHYRPSRLMLCPKLCQLFGCKEATKRVTFIEELLSIPAISPRSL